MGKESLLRGRIGGHLFCVANLYLEGTGTPEFVPDHAGKGSLLSSYEGETGLLWMWAGLSCFLSSGDGYAGEFLSCSKGLREPLEVPEVSVSCFGPFFLFYGY